MTSTYDPVSLAVVRASVVSIAREIFQTFKRTALLPVIYEVNDFSVSVYDDRLNLIGDDPGLPEFVGSLDITLQAITEQFQGDEVLREGDVVIVNDPFLTGAHSSDVAVVVPAFLDGSLIGYVGIRAHVGDMGAKDSYPCNSQNIYEEGLIIPPVKLYDRGVKNRIIERIIGANSRLPRETFGNLVAAGLALAGGAQRLTDLVRRYGVGAYHASIDQLIEQTDREVRRCITAIPDGVYRYEDKLDNNGIEDAAVPLVVTVTIAGSEITIDTTGSSGQQLGPMNSSLPETLGACRLALKRITTQDLLPTNSGDSFCLTVVAPEGTIFNAQHPAATYLMGWTVGRLGDMIVQALAQDLPHLFPAQSGGDAVVVTGGHTDPASGRATFFADSPPPGYGATQGEDGMDALLHVPLAGTELTSAEIWETRMPVRKLSCTLLQDSGGPGLRRGGLGSRTEWEFLEDAELTLFAEKTKASEAQGTGGGLPSPNSNSIVINEGSGRELVIGKLSGARLAAGDRVSVVGGGGGGHGDPFTREPERVLRDVETGSVSIRGAAVDYGVVITTDGYIDLAGTDALRTGSISEHGDAT